MEISTYVALLNAQNAEIIWYVDGRIIKRKVQRTDNQAITFVHYSIVQEVLPVSNSINAEVVERNQCSFESYSSQQILSSRLRQM